MNKYTKMFAVLVYTFIVYNSFNIVYKYAILKENINLFVLYIGVTVSFMSIPVAIALIVALFENKEKENNHRKIRLELSSDGTYKNNSYILKSVSGCWYLLNGDDLIDHGMDKEKLINRANLELN